jgi:acyl carrier protein
MSTPVTSATYSRDSVFQDLTGILTNMTRDWAPIFKGAIQPETRVIADLGFESIDVVQLVMAIEEHYQRRDLPVGELVMVDGRYVDELTVGDIVNFLARHLNRA